MTHAHISVGMATTRHARQTIARKGWGEKKRSTTPPRKEELQGNIGSIRSDDLFDNLKKIKYY